MRINEVRELDKAELGKELADQERGLMNLRFRKATLQLTDTNEIKNSRRTIARIKTVIRERDITAGIEGGEPTTEKSENTKPDTETETAPVSEGE